MSVSSGRSSIRYANIIEHVSEGDIAFYYLNITQIPCLINSPLRIDRKPSMGITSSDGQTIGYVDFATGDKGNLMQLLVKMWNIPYDEVLVRIYKDIPQIKDKNINIESNCRSIKPISSYSKDVQLQCKIREWKEHDIQYWQSYGIELEWLKFADIYPISHKIITKNGNKFTFIADKYAYAYVERKEDNITLKIYQPYNTDGFKWSNKHDSSVISLWRQMPETGDIICICASLKDALCLWSNTGIPAIATQGEGYGISSTAVNELKKRFKNIYILFDNDEAGIIDAEKLSDLTGFTNIVLPKIDNAKDISDLYKTLNNKEQFNNIIINLFKI